MPPKKKAAATTVKAPSLTVRVASALEWLQVKSTPHDVANLKRFAINAKQAYGVSMANMKVLAKQLGRDHDLAEALWQTGWHEARMVATMVDDPARITAAQMDRWCRDFDNWGICDTACFVLFDRTSHAFKMVDKWCDARGEFVKRTAFALLWSMALHHREEANEQFLHGLQLIEDAATDERNFVKKAVNMALRAIGRRNAVLNAAAIEAADRLAATDNATARWVGKHALRELKKHCF